MRAKFLICVCVFALGLGGLPLACRAEVGGPLETAADAIVVRPACLVATTVGSVVFLIALPWAAASKSIKQTADALVVKPAAATFTRPLGDMDALRD
jgi:hypothetical protein